MAAEISPALYEIIVAVSHKAVDDRLQQVTVMQQDLGELKGIVRDLAVAQARTEARVEELAVAQARTEARVEELAVAQARTEARVEELAVAQARTEARVEELAVAQARTEARLTRLEATVEQLAVAQVRTEAALQALTAQVLKLTTTVERLVIQVDDLRGWQLEQRYRERAASYFGRLLRRVRVVPLTELENALLARLDRDEFLDLLELDLLVNGIPREAADAPDVWLAVEISGVIAQDDLERARRRAAILRRAGYRAIPTVAGKEIPEWLEQEARTRYRVLLLQDGRTAFWPEALQEALALS
ncbi:MAG: hypothetical protein HY741_22120 [Chloroflexi bacterium]|nr:hypothetical protein [Chloroflexota bacterium]